jgi:phosphoglycolate phosphatase-like HAD superfamily hydrolase
MIVNQQVRSCFADPEIVVGIDRIMADHPNCLVLIDARDAAAAYHGAILKVNAHEAAALLGEPKDVHRPTHAITAMAHQIMRRTGCPVFVTRGERGLVGVDATGVYDALGVQVLGPVDPVGAGDTVVATIAATLASGGDTESATYLANLAASITVGKRGTTGTANPEEIHRLIDDCDYVYSADLADVPGRRRYVENTGFELVDDWPSGLHVEHVIFDHDGTLSTLRQGWEDVMAPMMVEAILGRGGHDVSPSSRAEVARVVADLIDRTTGVQTLLQMDSLVQLVAEFGLVPASEIKDGPSYKQDYNQRLMELVEARRNRLVAGDLDADDFLMKGSMSLLKALRTRGVTLYLVSGTDAQDVKSEAALLGIAEYFGDHIYGAVGESRVEMKKVVLQGVVDGNHLGGRTLATFGDGPVEMRETRKRGGLAIGVCSDEVRRHGFNEVKRRRLVRGGATLLIPDYGRVPTLMSMLFADDRESTALVAAMQQQNKVEEYLR